ALEAGVKCFNVESEAELERLAQVAASSGRVAPISLRVNPDVDAHTHPYISTGLKENKFGIDIERAPEVYRRAKSLPGLEIVGVDSYIGSQITDAGALLGAVENLIVLLLGLRDAGIELHHLDLGGGIGIRDTDEEVLQPVDLFSQVFERLERAGLGHLELVLEPGRSLVGNAGVLLTEVQYLKHSEAKNFAIVDAAMNDLLRPTLYDAWHDVEAVNPRPVTDSTPTYDIVGPICESGDWLARDRRLELHQG